jgi:hypothetical protein
MESTNKRHRISTDSRNAKLTRVSDYWLNSPIPTSNRFDGSENMSTDAENDSLNSETQKPNKPPPIFIQGVKNVTPLTDLLNRIAKDNYKLKVLNFDQVKLQPNTSDRYTIITKALIEKKTEFHTYKPKSERNFRVLLKNMHYSDNTSYLKQAIEELGHTVENIWNIQHSRTKAPLPVFFTDLKPAVTKKTIYEIEYLLNLKIKFEPPNFNRDVPQCANCQRYGHTKKYCNLKLRCVKCAGYHLTTDCPRKERSPNVKCVLYEGNHPANSKDCVVYKDLKKKNSLHLGQNSLN